MKKKNFISVGRKSGTGFQRDFGRNRSVGNPVGNRLPVSARPMEFPMDLFRRIFFCDEWFPDDTFSVVISVGDPVFRRKRTLFPSVFPSQIRCIFVNVLQRCEDMNLVLNWEKCHFMVQEGVVFGRVVSNKGIKVDKANVKVIEKLPPPTC